MSSRRVLLIGWDAADWKVISPLIDDGKMPNLARLIEAGVIGDMTTIDPPLSPMLWTTISTGRRPYDHGVIGLVEPDPSGAGVRPYQVTARRVKALWNIATQQGLAVHQIGWWPSHPAEPISGVAVSDFFSKAPPTPITEGWPAPEGAVHPPELTETLAALRVHPHELTAAHILPIVPNAAALDQRDPKVQLHLNALRQTIAEAATIQSLATWTLEQRPWDLACVYFDSIDHFGHGFMRYHPPRREGIDEQDFETWRRVVTAGYMLHDMMLGRLMQLVGPETTLMIVSDHGFHPGRLRPRSIPREPAGPAVEHSPYGIVVAAGPGIRRDERIYGASVLDVTPTVLHLLGLPVGEDMQGKVLADAFEDTVEVKTIPSWERVPGEDGQHPPDLREDPAAAAAALKQLIELGYIEPPSEDARKDAERAGRENRFYLSRSLADGGRTDEAVALLRGLFEEDPEASRFATYLVQLCLRTGRVSEAREVVQALRGRISEEKPGLFLLQGLVAIGENDGERALRYLQRAADAEPDRPETRIAIGRALVKLRRWQQAEEAFVSAMEIDPQSAAALAGLGAVHLTCGRYAEASERLLESVALQYHQPTTHFQLGEALLEQGETEAAADAFRIALHMAPGFNRARRLLADTFDRLDRADEAETLREEIRLRTEGHEILVVSGLPRSGTSMLMQMLAAGGIEPFSDEVRSADESNPLGYFEHGAVTALGRDQTFLDDVGDRAVKIVAPLLERLPDRYRYKVILIDRDLDEVLASQARMLSRQGKKGVPSLRVAEGYQRVMARVRSSFALRPNVSLTTVEYREVVHHPLREARRIAEFLSRGLDTDAMATVVDPELHREQTRSPSTF